jgi:predicted PilT family ATPase
MQDITELESRISAALARIGAGIDVLSAPAAAQPETGAVDESAMIEIGRLNDALDEEKMANAQLHERLRVIREREAEARSGLEAQLADALGELTALRAARAEEAAEIAEIVAALTPIVEETSHA